MLAPDIQELIDMAKDKTTKPDEMLLWRGWGDSKWGVGDSEHLKTGTRCQGKFICAFLKLNIKYETWF